MSQKVMMQEMTWTDYQRRLNEESPIVFLPVGALEQHGPHLPMGTDALLSTAVARLVAEQLGGIVAPAVSYGYKSQPRMGGGNHFIGTTSLDAQTLICVVRDVLREFVRHGVRKIVVLDGHYENQMFLIEAIDLVLRETQWQGIDDLRIVRFEYWDFTSDETLAEVFPEGFPGYALEHAAVMETSMVLHLYPELVKFSEIPDDAPASFPAYDSYPVDPASVPPSGVLSPAHRASATKGRLLAEEYARVISAAVAEAFSPKHCRKGE